MGKVAKIFDPLGLVSLFVVQAKILIQDLWTMGVGWDDPVTQREHYAQQWSLELDILKEITIPRSLSDSKEERSNSAHTLLDASNSAYGAVSYLRCTYDEECYKVSMIASKTRVTPLTPMTTL